jgi:hypothetical protein
VVERAWVENGVGKARVRFSEREEVQPIFKDVKDGIIRNVSVGYKVHRFDDVTKEEEFKQTKTRTLRAVDWEPYEVSLVPIPADAGAGIRSERSEKNECEIELRDFKGGDSMPNAQEPQQEPTKPAVEPVDKEAIRKEAVEAERARVSEINTAVRAAKLGEEFAQKLVGDGTSVDQARKLIIEQLARKSDETPINPHVTVQGGRDERDAFRAGLQNVLENRFDHRVEVKDMGRELYGYSLRELARESLRRSGQPTGGNVMDMVGRAFHSTSDFPLALANVIDKKLRAAYAEAPETWKPLVNETDVPDFKSVDRVQVGDFPGMLEVKEGAEFTRGTASETKESYAIKTYGRIIGVTRQLIINDDLGAIQRIVSAYGSAAKSLIADLVYGLINGGAATYQLSDGEYIYSNAHANIATGETTLADGLANMRLKMRKQTSLDGRYLNLIPMFLVAGAEREDEIEKAQSDRFVATQASGDNSFIRMLSAVTDPRLSSAPYYIFASPSMVDTIEVAYLQGTGRSVFTEQKMGFDVDGMEIKARLDVGAKWIDHRGVVYNDGSD